MAETRRKRQSSSSGRRVERRFRHGRREQSKELGTVIGGGAKEDGEGG